jgi:uncharacterized protein (TIGR03546 family)
MQHMIFLRPLRFLAQALILETTPRQLAWGFALGMLIGLIPKGNLIAVALMTLFCALRINVAAGTAAISLFTWCGIYLDPISHRLGNFLLTQPELQSVWTTLFNKNLVPWTEFNNTVVLGSTLIGLALLLPAYGITRPLFCWFAVRWAERLKKFRVVQVLKGGELAGKLA